MGEKKREPGVDFLVKKGGRGGEIGGGAQDKGKKEGEELAGMILSDLLIGEVRLSAIDQPKKKNSTKGIV